jgi:parvulin-like peptidyl-prolyl isomerase
VICTKRKERAPPDKRMRKRFLFLTVAIAMALSGCSTGTSTTKTLDTESAVFTIEKDNETVDAVSESYAWLYTLIYKNQYESFFGSDFWDEEMEDGTTYGDMFKEEILEEIKQVKVLALEAEENGVTLTDEELDICQSNAEEYIDSIEEATQELTGITVDTLAEYEADYTLYDKYKNELLEDADVEIAEDDVRQSDFFILDFETIDYDDDGEEVEYTDEEKAAQKKKAEEAYAMLEEGKDIEDVAEEFGFDTDVCQLTTGKTAEEDQDEYYDEAFETAAFSLKEGEYSKVTECNDGYYIIKMITEDNEEETAAALESAEEEKAEELFTPMLEEMEDKYEVTMNEENWDKISFTADIAFVEDDEDSSDDEEELEEQLSEEEVTEDEDAAE